MKQPNRASQFSPYAALKGFGDYLSPMERLREERTVLGEDAARELDEQLRRLCPGDTVRLCRYADERRQVLFGVVDKLRAEERVLLLNGVSIPFDDILSLEICHDAEAAQDSRPPLKAGRGGSA